MVVGLPPRLELSPLPISPSHCLPPIIRNFALDLSPFHRLLHPPAIRFLLYHIRAYPAIHGGGGAYDPETYDVPELPGGQGAAELVPRVHGFLQRELRDERLVGLRDRRVPGASGLSADANCTYIHE